MKKLINGGEEFYACWYEEDGKYYFEDDNEKAELTELPDNIYWDDDKGYLLQHGESLDTIVK